MGLTSLQAVKGWLTIADKPVTGITKANPAVVSCSNHNLVNGKQIALLDVLGMTQVNGNNYTVTIVDKDSFSIGIDSTGFGAYTSGGFVGVDDVVLNYLIEDVSAWIIAEVSRPLFSQSFGEKYSGKGTAKLMLKNYPITSIASLQIDGCDIPFAQTPNAPGYTFDDNVVYLNGYRFTRCLNNIVVNYIAGYLPGDSMLNLASRICIRLVALAYKERERIGQRSVSMAGQTTSYDIDEMPKDVAKMLNRLRRVFPA